MADTSFVTASSSSGTYATALSISSAAATPNAITATGNATASASASASLVPPPQSSDSCASLPLGSSHLDLGLQNLPTSITTSTSPTTPRAEDSDRQQQPTVSRPNSPRPTASRKSSIGTDLRQSVLLSPIAIVNINVERLAPATSETERDQARKRLAALNTRSTGFLRSSSGGSTPKGPIQRERAYSDSRPTPPLAQAPQALPQQSTITMPPVKEKKGGFSAFIRRLTKRKPHTSTQAVKLGVKDVNVQVVQPPTRSGTVSKGLPASVPARAPLAPAIEEAREPTAVFTSAAMSVPASGAPAPASRPLLSPAQSIASAHRLATAASRASSLGVPPSDVDPVNVPLPPSPNVPDDPTGLSSISSMITPSTEYAPTLTPVEAPSAMSPYHLASPHVSLPRSRSASPRASPRPIPGLAASRLAAPPAVPTHAQDDESVETIDEVRPLESLRINTRARSMSPGQAGPLSAGASSVADTIIQTPSTFAASPPLPASSLGSAMGAGGLGIALSKEESDGETCCGSIPEEPSSAPDSKLHVQDGDKPKVASASDDEREEMRDDVEEIDYLETPMYAGSSPPRKAPIGSAPVSLGRKESKWRKSVMGLSDIRSGSLGRKTSSRQPAPAEDVFANELGSRQPRTLARSGTLAAQQQQHQPSSHRQQSVRRQNHRVSCQPTLHSNASIAAQVRGIKDDKEKEAAETMFMM